MSRLQRKFSAEEVLSVVRAAEKAPTVVYIVQGEHWSTPGQPMTAHATKESAEREALSLVNVMLHDLGYKAEPDPKKWAKALGRVVARLLDIRDDADDCDVWITELPVQP